MYLQKNKPTSPNIRDASFTRYHSNSYIKCMHSSGYGLSHISSCYNGQAPSKSTDTIRYRSTGCSKASSHISQHHECHNIQSTKYCLTPSDSSLKSGKFLLFLFNAFPYLQKTSFCLKNTNIFFIECQQKIC